MASRQQHHHPHQQTPTPDVTNATPENPEVVYSLQNAWVVQPTFEIVAYLDHITSLQLAFLNRHAESTSSLQHTAHYRLTRDSVYQGLESGTPIESLLATLQSGARNQLPQNILVELRSWVKLREQTVLHRSAHLVEYASKELRDAALALHPSGAAGGMSGDAVGERFVLLQSPMPLGDDTLPGVDYHQPPVKCITTSESGELLLKAGSIDLLIAAQLSQWAEQVAPNHWQLTQASVSAALKTGANISELYYFLESRSNNPPPPFLMLALRHWASNKRPKSATVENVILLRHSNPKIFETLLASKQLQPYLRDRLGQDAVLVDVRAADIVKRLLAWARLAD